MAKKRKVPQRKCVVTDGLKSKKEMIRVVRNKENEVFIDPTGKKNGRGAYLTIDLNVIRQAQDERVLEKVFHTSIDPELYDELKQLATDQSNE